MPGIPQLSENQLEAVCDVLGETSTGLTGTEIGNLLARCRIDDPSPGITKRKRLFEALHAKQQHDECADNVGVPFESRFTVSRTGEKSVLWYRFRDQKGNSGSEQVRNEMLRTNPLQEEARRVLRFGCHCRRHNFACDKHN
jgi:hypothetical protein